MNKKIISMLIIFIFFFGLIHTNLIVQANENTYTSSVDEKVKFSFNISLPNNEIASTGDIVGILGIRSSHSSSYSKEMPSTYGSIFFRIKKNTNCTTISRVIGNSFRNKEVYIRYELLTDTGDLLKYGYYSNGKIYGTENSEEYYKYDLNSLNNINIELLKGKNAKIKINIPRETNNNERQYIKIKMDGYTSDTSYRGFKNEYGTKIFETKRIYSFSSFDSSIDTYLQIPILDEKFDIKYTVEYELIPTPISEDEFYATQFNGYGAVRDSLIEKMKDSFMFYIFKSGKVYNDSLKTYFCKSYFYVENRKDFDRNQRDLIDFRDNTGIEFSLMKGKVISGEINIPDPADHKSRYDSSYMNFEFSLGEVDENGVFIKKDSVKYVYDYKKTDRSLGYQVVVPKNYECFKLRIYCNENNYYTAFFGENTHSYNEDFAPINVLKEINAVLNIKLIPSITLYIKFFVNDVEIKDAFSVDFRVESTNKSSEKYYLYGGVPVGINKSQNEYIVGLYVPEEGENDSCLISYEISNLDYATNMVRRGYYSCNGVVHEQSLATPILIKEHREYTPYYHKGVQYFAISEKSIINIIADKSYQIPVEITFDNMGELKNNGMSVGLYLKVLDLDNEKQEIYEENAYVYLGNDGKMVFDNQKKIFNIPIYTNRNIAIQIKYLEPYLIYRNMLTSGYYTLNGTVEKETQDTFIKLNEAKNVVLHIKAPTPSPTPTATPSPTPTVDPIPTEETENINSNDSTLKTPLPPEKVTVKIVNCDATVVWKASKGATSYKVYYRKQNGKYSSIRVKGLKTNVKNLKKSTKYYFKVSAVNSRGEGKSGAAVVILTGH